MASFKIKRKISAPGRLNGPSRMHSNSLSSPAEEEGEDVDNIHYKPPVNRKHSGGYDRRRVVFDQLKQHHNFVKDSEHSNEFKGARAKSKSFGDTSSNNDIGYNIPTDPGEVTLFYLIQDFMNSALFFLTIKLSISTTLQDVLQKTCPSL